ncbi:MAG: DUF4926 domain-containing protein [Bryobacteraceae bacterium]
MEILSVVALLEDLPGEGLVRGQVGTVVETYAMAALKAEQLIRLHHQPVHQAA